MAVAWLIEIIACALVGTLATAGAIYIVLVQPWAEALERCRSLLPATIRTVAFRRVLGVTLLLWIAAWFALRHMPNGL